jgi:geranylgeranyl pyrophosphate synthase
MSFDVEKLRDKLQNLLYRDAALANIFPLAGNLERAKFSRARLLTHIAAENELNLDLALEAGMGLEVVHLATLIHDDVIDEADLRREKRSFRNVKGDRGAILFGDYLFSTAIHQIQSTQNSGCAKLFTNRVFDTCRGESIQDLLLTWEDSSPNEALLEEAALGKTGALFSFCTEAPFWFADFDQTTRSKAGQVGLLFGLGFQLADDLLDLAGDTLNLGKKAGNDLVKNTMTIPLFYLMQEKGLNWKQLRETYVSNLDQLKDDFFQGTSYPKLLQKIESTYCELTQLTAWLEERNITIKETAEKFWDNYVIKRMMTLNDLKPSQI